MIVKRGRVSGWMFSPIKLRLTRFASIWRPKPCSRICGNSIPTMAGWARASSLLQRGWLGASKSAHPQPASTFAWRGRSVGCSSSTKHLYPARSSTSAAPVERSPPQSPARCGCGTVGCRVPGCGRKYHLHAHHIEAWADGGKTSQSNLALLCPSHHALVHEGQLTVEVAEGKLEFKNAHGLPIPVVPPRPYDPETESHWLHGEPKVASYG